MTELPPGVPQHLFNRDILEDPSTFFEGIKADKNLSNIENVESSGVYYNPYSFSYEVWFVRSDIDHSECVGGIPLIMAEDNPHYALRQLENLVYMMLQVAAEKGWPGKGLEIG